MVDQTPKQTSASIFAPTQNLDQHLIDQLILERCPTWSSHWSWPLISPIILGIMGYKRSKFLSDKVVHMGGAESFEFLAETLDFKSQTLNYDKIPRTGRLMLAANHPTGLADGVAFWNTVKDIRPDAVFFANADVLRAVPKGEDFIIPVEWVVDKRTPAKTRETLRRARNALNDERCIIIFPAGKLAKMIDATLTEQEWLPTVVSLARKYKAPILPVNIKARNSRLYYWLCNVSDELRDITLFRELVNKRGSEFRMQAGNLIDHNALEGDIFETTTALREYVSLTLEKDAEAIFAPIQ